MYYGYRYPYYAPPPPPVVYAAPRPAMYYSPYPRYGGVVYRRRGCNIF